MYDYSAHITEIYFASLLPFIVSDPEEILVPKARLRGRGRGQARGRGVGRGRKVTTIFHTGIHNNIH